MTEVEARRGLAMVRWQEALAQGDVRARDYSEEANALTVRSAALRDDVHVLETELSGRGVVPLDLFDHQAAWVPTGGRPIAVAMRDGGTVIRAIGPERDRDRISAARNGVARPFGQPGQAFSVTVANVAPETAQDIPSAALGRGAGGTIAVDPTDSTGRRAAEPMVAVLLRPRNNAAAMRPGQRVDVRLRGPLRPIGVQIADRLAGFLGAPPVG